MELQELIKQLNKKVKKDKISQKTEVRQGLYVGSTSIIEGVYYDEDKNIIVIY